MSNEILVTYGLTATKGSQVVSVPQKQLQRDWSGQRRVCVTQNIGTSYEALDVTDLGSAGYAFFKNLDATNYVEIGVVAASTFYPLLKLKPGDAAVCPLTTLSVYAQANTAAVDLDYTIMEA